MGVKPINALIVPSPTQTRFKGIQLDQEVSGVSSDSRDCQGKIYFAIPGTRVDGHSFVASALTNGAVAVVVENESVFSQHSPAILVENVRKAYGEACSHWFGDPSKSLRVVGVTGTNGKTTTAYLLKAVWDELHGTSGVIGTVNYWVGDQARPAPLTTPGPGEVQSLLQEMTQKEVKRAVMEVSSIALDQLRVWGVEYDVAIFSNLTQDHLDYHQDFESYFLAKMRLFRDYPTKHHVVNGDDPFGQRLIAAFPDKTLSYGLHGEYHFTISNLVMGRNGSEGMVHTPVGDLPFQIPLIGEHNLYNFLSVVGASYALGEELPKVIASLGHATGAPGRLESVGIEGGPRVFVDYAHTDDALKNVLGAIRGVRGGDSGRIITVFGCGGDRDKTKRPKMAAVACSLSDVVIATSDNPRTENPDRILDDVEKGIEASGIEYHREVDRRKAIDLALSLAGPDDFVLIAGKGHETYQILGTETVPFDDGQVVRRYYENH